MKIARGGQICMDLKNSAITFFENTNFIPDEIYSSSPVCFLSFKIGATIAVWFSAGRVFGV